MRKYFKFLIYLVALTSVSPSISGAYDDFFRAVHQDDPQTLGSLLARGFDPNSVDESGQPALVIAAREGSQRAVDALLARPDLKVDLKNRSGETALMLAALKGHAALVVRLLGRGASANQSGWSPLHYAATGPDVGIVRVLIERGAALDARSPNATTPLMMAAQYGSEQSVDLLLARGADARLRNDRGLNAADFARLGGRDKLADRLASMAR